MVGRLLRVLNKKVETRAKGNRDRWELIGTIDFKVYDKERLEGVPA